MNFRRESQAYVDDEGRLVIPQEVISLYGLKPGTEVRIERNDDSLTLRRPVTHLRKVYIEPTNRCNLECRTCIRNVWDEPLGQMSRATFDRIIEGLRGVSPPPTIFFAGFGEPLAHPDIIEMVLKAKSLGSPVELITNGTMLTREISNGLIEAGLDMLWVSIDGATPESYADVRLGATLPKVLSNLANLRNGIPYPHFFDSHETKPKIGIIFVAMKRNIADLPSVLRLSTQLGATRVLVTNVLPHTPDLSNEILYAWALTDIFSSSYHLEFPKMDLNEVTREAFYSVMRSGYSLSFAGANLAAANDRCPFIEKGATVIGWTGDISPCLPLLHDHVSYLNGFERFSRRYKLGNLAERDLYDLWSLSEYVGFRERVQTFDFSYCTFCGGCDLVEKNEEDCFGNTFPTCGGCLWAQGIIRCP